MITPEHLSVIRKQLEGAEESAKKAMEKAESAGVDAENAATDALQSLARIRAALRELDSIEFGDGCRTITVSAGDSAAALASLLEGGAE